MSAAPKTVLRATPEEEAAIRAAVRQAGRDNARTLLSPAHEDALFSFFSDPSLSYWIYDLPRPLTIENTRAWIADRVMRHERGECLCTVTFNEAGEIASYSDTALWPDRSSAEITGGGRAERQNSGRGSANTASAFDFIFEVLGVRLMCVTAALDNVRSQRAIDNAGFVRMGGRDAVRPDGTIRPSIYWEMTREQWRARKAAAQG